MAQQHIHIGWACKSCAFINSISFSHCYICGDVHRRRKSKVPINSQQQFQEINNVNNARQTVGHQLKGKHVQSKTSQQQPQPQSQQQQSQSPQQQQSQVHQMVDE